MNETIRLGALSIQLTRKAVKHVHLSVHPPDGRVTLVAPAGTRTEVVRAYAISKLGWITAQQSKLRSQAREPVRRFVERESHYLWGRRHLLSIEHRDSKPMVSLDHRRITLAVRPGSTPGKRAQVIQVPASQDSTRANRKVGIKTQRASRGLLPATHEDEVGELQPSHPPHPAQYGTREEAEGPPRIRHHSRNDAPVGADPQRSLHRDTREALPNLARSALRTQ
jgi:hypothetical protein